MIFNERISRIRGHGLTVFAKRLEGLPMEEALRRVDDEGLVLASNKRLGSLASGEWKETMDVFPCWSGTMAAYDKCDKKLGNDIKYTDPMTGIRYIFPVPEEHIGKKNVVLVAEHPDFVLVREGHRRIVKAAQVGAVEMFPTVRGGWFAGDPRYDIPRESRVPGNERAGRSLKRIEKRVGFVARNSWLVDLGCLPAGCLGVAVEAPEATGKEFPGIPIPAALDCSSGNKI